MSAKNKYQLTIGGKKFNFSPPELWANFDDLLIHFFDLPKTSTHNIRWAAMVSSRCKFNIICEIIKHLNECEQACLLYDIEAGIIFEIDEDWKLAQEHPEITQF